MDVTCWVFTVCFSLFVSYGTCEITMAADAIGYLTMYNYMPQQDMRTGALRSPTQVREAVMAFQRMANINVSGVIDSDTMRMMNMPRCGMADITGMGNTMHTRRKRYNLQGSMWPKNDLTYRVSRYTPDMSQRDVDSELKRAFKVWSDVTPLTFRDKRSGAVDIDIIFAGGDHGDGNPFDGPSRVLAHAYFPQFGGDSHFDEAEMWTLNTRSGINLFQVAAHEFGHALGLSHSDVQSALMAPFYAGFQPNFKLDNDDVSGIQRIYGRAPTPPPKTTRAPMPPPPPTVDPDSGSNPCVDGKLDAMLSSPNGMTYAFRGKYFYYLDAKVGFYFSNPMMISQGWPGLPNDLDSAFTHGNGKMYFFKGPDYWRYSARRTLDNGYPKKIRNGFRLMVDKIDAAFVWSGNGKIYFIKGDKYWRYQGSNMDGSYPRSLSLWTGLPATVDVAFKWSNNKRTYFFKDSKYYRFNDRTFKVDNGYPKDTAKWWFRCEQGEKIKYGPEEGEMANGDGMFVLAGVNVTSTVGTLSQAGHMTYSVLVFTSSIGFLLFSQIFCY